MKVIAIIPAYNEEESIVPVIENFIKVCPQYDYVIVNDGGSDHTLDICREHGFNVVSLPINLGLSGAFQTGMKYAMRNDYDVAVQFDADGQHLPQYIPALIDTMQKGDFDIVIGSRFVDQEKPTTMRMLGSRVISGAIRLTTGKTIKDPTSGMRAFNKAMIYEFAKMQNHAPEPDTLSYLMRRGLKFAEVQVSMEERIAGTSYLNVGNSIKYMMRMCISILLIQWFRGGDKLHEKENKKELEI